jgi:hypothetical protein
MHDTDHTTTPWRRHRGRRRLTLLSAAAAVAVLGAGCTIDRDPLAGWDLPEVDWIAELRPADCDTLVQAAAPTLRAQAESSWAAPVDAGSGWFGGGDDQAVSADGAGDAAVPTAPAAPMAPAERSALAQPEAGPPTTMAAAGAEADAAAGQAGGDDASVVIGTNNQEVAVDESDLVKTDGRRLVSIVNGVLRVVVLDDTPTIDSTLDLRTRGATELFLRGDTALVLGTTYRDTWYGDGIVDDTVVWEEPSAAAAETDDPAIAPTTVPPTAAAPTTIPPTTIPPTTVEPTTTVPTTTAPTTVPSSTVPSPTITVPPTPAPFAVATTLTLVSLVDPAAPQVVASTDVEGSLVTARDAAGRARVVVQSTPVATEQLSMATTRSAALAAVDGLDEADLLPRMATGGQVQTLGDCDDVLVTPALSPAPDTPTDRSWSAPLGTVTVLTVGDDLGNLQPVSVQGNAETVYASTASLYVAAASWDQGGSRTDVHRFSLTGDGPTSYTGSGRAPGHLLNQFSLSERGGALRLVTTLDGGAVGMSSVDGPAVDVAPVGASSARLTVLDTDGTLDEIGHLDGMGIGEQVQSVRFMDDLAYVVTFRQVDPLYALDLSDPRAPRLLGELKIPGFSEYLHPVGDGLLLGVGREVDPDTGIDEGLKVSLFDVSDPLTMRETDQIVLPMARSEVSSDHRAFLWDPSRRQAVVPVELSGCDMSGRCDGTPGGAALVLRADRDGLVEVGRFAHEPLPGWSLQPNRTVLVDDDLWSVSIASIGRTDADAPTGASLLRF